MRTDEPRVIRLADYAPPLFTIETVDLDVRLDPERTHVVSRLAVKRTSESNAPLRLDGEDLEFIAARIDGAPAPEGAVSVDDHGLSIDGLGSQATVEIESAFSPKANTALSGIYLSNDRVFSQCEPEGFRRITYFPDRPDILARYTTRITAEKAAYPHLLSNGNKIEAGELSDGRHYAVWNDPFPKPSYLFALVAGEFDLLEDSFTTASGRTVALEIFVDPGDAPRATYALDALKRAMAWDEAAFNREYDLDLFMIVAVRDFNFGAMENKGLNIFNSSLLLANADSATDMDYERIESVVAHEYFHNWTGNRITCRDWFQLCLKEGLTVYRDQAFSGHERGDDLTRIKNVRALRARQFPEDAGPLAHPVRPPSYMKIDNFYTATVYEKGAELVRALSEILGPDDFRAGMDLYFERCDGMAATMEDFLACFEQASGRDLSQFLTWYGQAGTPHVTVSTTHNEQTGALDVTVRQTTPATPGQADKQPVPIPIKVGLLGPDGRPIPIQLPGGKVESQPEHTLVLDAEHQTWRFDQAPAGSVVSALRGFSAPVILQHDEPIAALALRAAHDTDAFNRWEAGQDIARLALSHRVKHGAPDADLETAWRTACANVLAAAEADPGLSAITLAAPDEPEIAQHVEPVDTDAIRAARLAFMTDTANALHTPLLATLDAFAPRHAFSADAASAGRRALHATALTYLAHLDNGVDTAELEARISDADNLTDRLAALNALDMTGASTFETALAAFYDRWSSNAQVIDKWFALQARSRRPDAVARAAALLDHPAYDERTPNRVYAVLGAFGFGNLAGLHQASGEGYALYLEHVARIDRRNPAVAARLMSAMEIWPRLDEPRKAKAQKALEGLRERDKLSANVYEMVVRSLNAQA